MNEPKWWTNATYAEVTPVLMDAGYEPRAGVGYYLREEEHSITRLSHKPGRWTLVFERLHPDDGIDRVEARGPEYSSLLALSNWIREHHVQQATTRTRRRFL